MTNPIRMLARLSMGTTYALLGIDAARAPGARVEQAHDTLALVRGVVPLPDDDELVVRVNGAAQAAAGVSLALGRAPRLSSLVLIGSLLPTTYAGHAFWTVEDPAARKMQRTQFLKNVAMVGGLLLAVVDRERRDQPASG